MRWLCWWRHPAMLRSCIVNFTDDPSTAIKGVLWSSRGPWLTFRSSSMLKTGQEPMLIDGEVLIHRDRVLFIEVL